MNSNVHDRAEVLAGAIALGEATDEERREYREHIAGCEQCLHAYGGEREIDRVASTVDAARESEVWQPHLPDVVRTHSQRRLRSIRYASGTIAASIAVALGLHFAFASPVVINAGQTRIVVEHSDTAPAPKPPAPVPVAPQRRMIVVHNVVQIARAPIAAASLAPVPKSAAAPQVPAQIAAITVHPNPRRLPARMRRTAQPNIPIWRRGDETWRTVATTTTTSLTESAPQSFTHHAESIQIAPRVTRDAGPVGGATAINPQPPMIAYDEGAEGTTAFEVLVDDRGNPTKCVITKSAGYAVLDSSVCKAAMQTRYTPKMVEGRAVAGVYRDAFTFRMSEDSTDVEGVPKQIP